MQSKVIQNQSHVPTRLIGAIEGAPSLPALVVFASLHGNEPSGLIALERIFEKIRERNIEIKGSFYGIAGNLCAIREQVRYCDEDLNRLFLEDRVQKVRSDQPLQIVEEQELRSLLQLTDRINERVQGEIFFIDCHTTSASSIPYISLNEGYHLSYLFAKGMAATSVMGVEREIKGCLAEWYNKLDWHGFTFEAGQHFAPESAENQEAIIWQGMEHAGCISESQCPDLLEWSHNVLYHNGEYHDTFYSVLTSYRIEPGEEFIMKPGYVNFQKIHKGELLATCNGEPVTSPANAHILMPLYQKQGSFGFFVAEEINQEYLDFKEKQGSVS